MNSIVYGTAFCLGGFSSPIGGAGGKRRPIEGIEGHQGLQNIEAVTVTKAMRDVGGREQFGVRKCR